MTPEQEQADELRHLRFQGAKTARHRPLACGRPTSAPAPRWQPPVNERPDHPDEFLCWLLDRAGLSISLYRTRPLERRLAACLRTLRVASTEAAQTRLKEHPELLPAALGSLLLGVTAFFRDPPVFDALRDLLPKLPSLSSRLRVWSVACSDGSELYSVAIVLAELALLDGSDLLGTDCRPEAIRQAQNALYSPAGLADLAPLLRQRYFEAEGGRCRVQALLRSRARFEVHDFFQHVQRGPWDVILWRNTAIYLNLAAARAVWQRLAEQLRPGGILITGKAERPDCGVPLTRLTNCIYMRTGVGT